MADAVVFAADCDRSATIRSRRIRELRLSGDVAARVGGGARWDAGMDALVPEPARHAARGCQECRVRLRHGADFQVAQRLAASPAQRAEGIGDVTTRGGTPGRLL